MVVCVCVCVSVRVRARGCVCVCVFFFWFLLAFGSEIWGLPLKPYITFPLQWSRVASLRFRAPNRRHPKDATKRPPREGSWDS